MSLILPFFSDDTGKVALVLLLGCTAYVFYQLLVPPKINDGGVPYIPAYRTLFWTFKPDPNRIDLCNKVDIPALRETGIVRSWLWGRWMYKINDPEYARQLFLKPSVFQKIEMQTALPYTFRVIAAGANIMSENGDHFKAHRAVVMPAFRRAWPVSHFHTHMDKMVGLIRQDGNGVDILNIGRRVALDILGHIIMGVDFGALDYTKSELLDMCWDVVEAGVEPLYLLFPFLDKYPLGKRARSFASVKRFHQFIDGAIETKRTNLLDRQGGLDDEERNHADLLTLMLEAYEQTKEQGPHDENGKILPSMTSEELRNNAVVFFIAGHDGTAYSLCHLITELALNPDIQQRARDRVISVIGDDPGAFPTDEQLAELADLDMIIRESMRKSSSASDVRRELTEPVNLGPYTLPKGAWVMVDLWALHHNPKSYPDPHKFIPERFAWATKSNAEMPHEHKPFSWAPFSEGGRKCMGHKFAMVAQRILLITFVHRFTWTLPADSPFWERPRTNTMGLILPVNLRVDFVPRHGN